MRTQAVGIAREHRCDDAHPQLKHITRNHTTTYSLMMRRVGKAGPPTRVHRNNDQYRALLLRIGVRVRMFAFDRKSTVSNMHHEC